MSSDSCPRSACALRLLQERVCYALDAFCSSLEQEILPFMPQLVSGTQPGEKGDAAGGVVAGVYLVGDALLPSW